MVQVFIRDAQFKLLQIVSLSHPNEPLPILPTGGYLEHVFPDGKKWILKLLK